MCSTKDYNEDYLYFYEPHLTPDRCDGEGELIWRLLALEEKMSVLDLACGHGRIANRLAQRGYNLGGGASFLFVFLPIPKSAIGLCRLALNKLTVMQMKRKR